MSRHLPTAARGLAIGLLLAAVPTVLDAQEAGTIDAGVAARWTTFDNSLQLKERWGFAGLASWFPRRNFSLEGQIAQIDTRLARRADVDVMHRTSYVRALVHYPVRDVTSFHVGAGYSFASYHDLTAEGDHGGSLVAGVRRGLTNRIGLRIDGTADYYPNPSNGTDLIERNWNYSVQVGLSFFVRGGLRPATPPPPPDADGDGVIDADDRCAGTPMGDRVDASGCSLPKDADGDGVVDANDRCANTPAGEAVDAAGCPLPRDADRDGVTDDRDRCPNTPAGATVNADGCEPPPPPPADTDNDGVPDTSDRCPNTTAGARVDAVGCVILFADTARTLTLRGVNFETGKAVLTPESRTILDEVASSLVNNPEVRVEVAGHTDNVGTNAANQRLSQQRAASVRQYLIDKGVDAARLRARGYGEDAPVTSNATAEGRAQNRRVELRRID